MVASITVQKLLGCGDVLADFAVDCHADLQLRKMETVVSE
jgi:hypothetical protein